MVLQIREFAFHVVNANLLWPGTLSFAEWLALHQHLLMGQKILELGSGTGALAIFLKKAFSADITTSDYNDEIIEENIAFNCKLNGLTVLPHIRHTWGDPFPISRASFDLIIASDILLYVKQYPNLIRTLLVLLNNFANEDSSIGSLQKSSTYEKSMKSADSLYKNCEQKPKNIQLPKPCFLMSLRRRLPKEDETVFFNSCEAKGLTVQHLGSRVYCIFKLERRLKTC
ncbi:hypothetical protein KP509_08G051500 [Ceratopteris richardii]|nr:hypothetical protein KP509_08G051500 [Ceratopteris richardii]